MPFRYSNWYSIFRFRGFFSFYLSPRAPPPAPPRAGAELLELSLPTERTVPADLVEITRSIYIMHMRMHTRSRTATTHTTLHTGRTPTALATHRGVTRGVERRRTARPWSYKLYNYSRRDGTSISSCPRLCAAAGRLSYQV